MARIDAIFAVEHTIVSLGPDERRAHRIARSAALVAELKAWLLPHYAKLSVMASVARAIDYMLKRWSAFISFLDDGPT